MVNESALKLAFSQIRQDFDLIRRQLQELNAKIETPNEEPNGNTTIHELQEIKNEISIVKTSINDAFLPEEVAETKIKTKSNKKEFTEEQKAGTQKKTEIISSEKISFIEEVEENVEEVNSLANEYY